MNLTPTETFAFIIALFGFCLTLMNIVDKIIAYKKMLHMPEEAQNERLSTLESKMLDIERHNAEIEKRSLRLSKGNEVYMKAMLAMMSHELDGNHTEELKAARDELNDYLLHMMN